MKLNLATTKSPWSSGSQPWCRDTFMCRKYLLECFKLFVSRKIIKKHVIWPFSYILDALEGSQIFCSQNLCRHSKKVEKHCPGLSDLFGSLLKVHFERKKIVRYDKKFGITKLVIIEFLSIFF